MQSSGKHYLVFYNHDLKTITYNTMLNDLDYVELNGLLTVAFMKSVKKTEEKKDKDFNIFLANIKENKEKNIKVSSLFIKSLYNKIIDNYNSLQYLKKNSNVISKFPLTCVVYNLEHEDYLNNIKEKLVGHLYESEENTIFNFFDKEKTDIVFQEEVINEK